MSTFTQEVIMDGVLNRNRQHKTKAQLDSAAAGADAGLSSEDAAAAHFTAKTSIDGASAVQEWLATISAEDFTGNKADALLDIIRGLVDGNNDGEITDEEQTAYELTADAAWAYLNSLGASNDDLDLIFNADDDTDDVEEAAMRVYDLTVTAVPDGEDSAADDLNDFVFNDDAEQSQMDAAYRKKLVIRHGRKVKINKRISGHVKRTSAQRLALQKAQRRSNTASARVMRSKSFKIGARLGTHKA